MSPLAKLECIECGAIQEVDLEPRAHGLRCDLCGAPMGEPEVEGLEWFQVEDVSAALAEYGL